MHVGPESTTKSLKSLGAVIGMHRKSLIWWAVGALLCRYRRIRLK